MASPSDIQPIPHDMDIRRPSPVASAQRRKRGERNFDEPEDRFERHRDPSPDDDGELELYSPE